MEKASIDHIIKMRDVSFGWASTRMDADRHGFHLDVAAFSMVRGEKVILTGPSGSGKSTLLGLICGTLQAASGSIEVCQRRIDAMSASKRDGFRADHIGVVFQLFNLVPYLSVLDNVILPLQFSKIRRERVGRSLATQKDRARFLLDQLGLDPSVAEMATNRLSVGQQQRVAAARALIGAPELIIADEPTSSLDAATQAGFLKLLFAQLEQTGCALLMVSHDERLAVHFDRTVQLSDILSVDMAHKVQVSR